MSPNPPAIVPDGYSSVTPWVIVRGAAAFIDFLAEVFGALERGRMLGPDGSIVHAEVEIGGAVVMLFDARQDWPDTPSFLRLYLADADAAYARALAAGSKSVTRPTDLFFGDRVSRVRDPWGNLWWLHTHSADPDPQDLARLAADPQSVEAMRYVQESLERELAGEPSRAPADESRAAEARAPVVPAAENAGAA